TKPRHSSRRGCRCVAARRLAGPGRSPWRGNSSASVTSSPGCAPQWRREGEMSYRHTVRVRYGECDMQSVVFNAHYLPYCDDAIDTWFRSVLAADGGMEHLGFDFMVKSV